MNTEVLTSLESIEMETEEIRNDQEIGTNGTIKQFNELSNDEILLFLRANELTVKEMNWLKSRGTLTESEVLKFIGQIMLKPSSE
jgi:hypothetical protein